MDPQKLSQLDPKLRDAYQRVMGTPVPQSQPKPAIPAEPEPQPTPAVPTQTIPFQAQAAKADQLRSETIFSPNFTTPAPQAQAITIKKKNTLMPILIGVVIFVFVVVYALFWAKIFNFKLPF